MNAIEKELVAMGNITKEPMQSVEEFLDGYKQYKAEKKNLMESSKGNMETRIEA